MVPSPQSTVYDPEPGMVMPRFRSELRHTVTNSEEVIVWSVDAAMPLPAASNTAFASMSSCDMFRFSIAVRWDCVKVMLTLEPDTATVSLAPGVTPSEDWPGSRMCILDLCTVEFRFSFIVIDSTPV